MDTKRMNRRTVALSVLVPTLACAASVAALARASRTVLFRGGVVSSDVSMVNGRPYVPLADMARALGGHVSSHGSGYEIVSGEGGGGGGQTAAGGANEVHGLNGKVGDMLFDGRWRFKVNDVQHTSLYNYRYYTSSGSDKPKGDNDELVVFTCQIKNGHEQTEEPILTTHGLGSQATALTDDQGQSYAPIDFDVRGGSMVPGSSRTFAVIFSVPKGTHLQTLIFSLYGFANVKVNNVRIALQ